MALFPCNFGSSGGTAKIIGIVGHSSAYLGAFSKQINDYLLLIGYSNLSNVNAYGCSFVKDCSTTFNSKTCYCFLYKATSTGAYFQIPGQSTTYNVLVIRGNIE